MANSPSPETVVENNQFSLRRLVRAIALSQGEFSLILVRCNYTELRQRLLRQIEQQIQETEMSPPQELHLPPGGKALFATIQAACSQSQNCLPQTSALMVVGLESAAHQEELLTAANQVRDEFRKQLPFPVVLWMTDDLLQKFLRLAPDFASWAATPIRFDLGAAALRWFMQQQAERCFDDILYPESDKSTSGNNGNNGNPPSGISRELEFALREVQQRGETLDERSQAEVQFVLGRERYLEGNAEAALTHFQASLTLWQAELLLANAQTKVLLVSYHTQQQAAPPEGRADLQAVSSQWLLAHQGVVQYYIGLCHCDRAKQQGGDRAALEAARQSLEQSIESFELADRPDLVARFVGQLAEVLWRLHQWNSLYSLVQRSLSLHQTHGTLLHVAQDYGFLAEVCLERQQWQEAARYAAQAVTTLRELERRERDTTLPLYPFLLAQIYQLLWVEAQQQLEQSDAATHRLQQCARALHAAKTQDGFLARAIALSTHFNPSRTAHPDPHQILRLIEVLRSRYFRQNCYREAYLLKQEQRIVEQQYGFRAFTGAGYLAPRTDPTADLPEAIASEIEASGRLADVHHLTSRISRHDCKLTILYGESGVGKSSIIHGGLVPMLKLGMGEQTVLPVVVNAYSDWVQATCRALTEAMHPHRLLPTNSPQADVPSHGEIKSLEALYDYLERNARENLLTVLIFDQFEEFFFVEPNAQQRQSFYGFFNRCLHLPFVKLVLSLRQDYLHHLLDLEHHIDLSLVPDRNLLDPSIRYPLGNLNAEDARSLVQTLTQRTHFYLEPMLIDQLVQDLNDNTEGVRPIKLQIVGSQLQAENITTLEQYRAVGQFQLIENFIEEVVRDCGSEQEDAARLILYALTDEHGNRSAKTRLDLAGELGLEFAQVDIVLDILVKSGLVYLSPEFPNHRYRLVHDYLVELVRTKEQQNLRQQLEVLRRREADNQMEINRLRREQTLLSEVANTRSKMLQETLMPDLENLGLAAAIGQLRQRREIGQLAIDYLQQEQRLLAALAEAKHKQRSSERWRNRWIGIFLTGSLLATVWLLVVSARATFQRERAALAEIEARNALSKALFLSDDRLRALLASTNAGSKLPRTQAPESLQLETENRLQQAMYGVREANRLEGHDEGIYDVTYSRQGDRLITASEDGTVNLWRGDGELLLSFIAHSDRVTGADFAPNGGTLATASWDKTVKLWQEGSDIPLATLRGHSDRVLEVAFSPTGDLLASVSADKTVRLWSVEEGQSLGNSLQTLRGHTAPVTSVSFSRNGLWMATGSADKTVRLWRREAIGQPFTPVRTLRGHDAGVYDVSFRPDGGAIASASADKTIKLWEISNQGDGTLLQTVAGHEDWVLGVSFSPNGQLLASAGKDHTVRVWNSDGTLRHTFRGHQDWVSKVSFSPDGKEIASASRDATVKLWRWHPSHSLLVVLQEHQQQVNWVSFNARGDRLATASRDKTAKIWHPDGRLLHTLTGHQESVTSVAFSPDGTILTTSADGTVKLWSMRGKLLKTLDAHQAEVFNASFSPDGTRIATASGDGTAKLWTTDGKLLHTLKGHSDMVFGVSFSPDGTLIATASRDKTVKLWDLQGKLLRTLSGHGDAVLEVSFSPDGAILAAATADRTVQLWGSNNDSDGSDGSIKGDRLPTAQLATLPSPGGQVTSVSFSPTGEAIASVSDDGIVRFWTRQGELLKIFQIHEAKVNKISFSPDGNALASASDDNTAIVWNLSLEREKLVQLGCHWLEDYLATNRHITQGDRQACKPYLRSSGSQIVE